MKGKSCQILITTQHKCCKKHTAAAETEVYTYNII